MGEAQELTVALVKLTLDSLYGISTEIAHIVKFCLVDEPQEINCVNLYYCSIIVPVQFSSVQSLSCVRLFATSWIAARQASLSITISRSSHKLTSIEWVMLSSHLILCRPLLFLPPISPSISLFQWVNSSHEVAKVLEFQRQHHSLQRNPRADLLQNGLVIFPCSPRDSQESSPTPQFKSINSSALSFLHSPTLTSTWLLEKT